MSIEKVAELIRDVPDFPKPGIVFKDITPLLADPEGFGITIEWMAERAGEADVEGILAIESRGFIFGAALAREIALPMQLVRKRGKLPREVVSQEYALEYGIDHIEVHTDAVVPGRRYLLVDDVIATGGTAAAVARLVERQSATLAACVFLMELGFLNGRAALGDHAVHALLRY
jgi:adenine phosphoribosyltransferase